MKTWFIILSDCLKPELPTKVFVLLGLLICLAGQGLKAAAEPSADLRALVEADWTAQEKRLGRAPDQPEALRQALRRADQLAADLRRLPGAPDLQAEIRVLNECRGAVEQAESLAADERVPLYQKLRWAAREMALKNPLLAGKPLVFMKRQRFICQMLHEYLGYFYDYGNVAGGGGVYVLEQPGRSLEVRDLLANRLPQGNFTTLALSFDARTLYFAFAPRAAEKTKFYSSSRRCFHLYSIQADGTELRQLTDSPEDDFDPCPLPDGGLAFMSTRRGGFARCNNPWEPIPTYTLHRMEADGSQPRTLSLHETAEWHPSVLNDGRLVYIRWDYVDRSAANFHGLWTCNLDGSNPQSVFGNYTMRINACYQPKAIPGSDRILFVAGAHHADVGGALVIVDPKRAALDARTGEDRFDSIEKLTPEICYPEAAGWPKSYFHSPCPLSENYFLTAFSHDPLPGMSSGEGKDTRTGLYYFDRFGNLELLYSDPQNSCMYPLPLAPRSLPPQMAKNPDADLGEEGEFMLTDARRSLAPMPAGRAVRELRIYQLLPKTTSHIVNDPRIGYANAENARMLLGSVPVERDGSAFFRAPARKPLYFQVVDDQGRAVQSMRSLTYLQPGERRGCVGCHEPSGASADSKKLLALQRPPSRITPGPDGTHPLSFPRLVQPVLDQHCARCHDGAAGEGKSKLALTGEAQKNFSQSYLNLKPYARWFEWGGESISQIATHPGHGATDESRLTKILDDANHGSRIELPDQARRRLYLWLDANAPFYGTYSKEEQLAQRKGEAVPPPQAQ